MPSDLNGAEANQERYLSASQRSFAADKVQPQQCGGCSHRTLPLREPCLASAVCFPSRASGLVPMVVVFMCFPIRASGLVPMVAVVVVMVSVCFPSRASGLVPMVVVFSGAL